MNMGTFPSYRIVGLVKRNPEGLLLLGAGLAFMCRTGPKSERFSPQDYRVNRSGRGYDAHAEDSRGRISGAMQGARDSASETASSLAQTATEFSDTARQTTSHYAQETQRVIQSTIRRQPVTVALAGIAAGIGLAAMLPVTRMEEDVFAPAGARLSAAASDMSDSVLEAASSVVGKETTGKESSGKSIQNGTTTVRSGS
jgi:hypothetical protein